MSEWISVKDELPESHEPFIARDKWGGISVVKQRSWGDPDWLVGGLQLSRDITHWMPLPEPPEEDGNA